MWLGIVLERSHLVGLVGEECQPCQRIPVMPLAHGLCQRDDGLGVSLCLLCFADVAYPFYGYLGKAIRYGLLRR